MGTFLVGWELGGERGHAALIEPVIEALRRRGHVVHVAARDPAALAVDDEPRTGRVVQAPAWPLPDQKSAGAAVSETVGDDFAATGLGDAGQVQLRARLWLDLVRALNADVVLAESAPTLLIAAHRRHRAIAFGTAYSLPPAGLPLPPVLDVRRQPGAASALREQALTAAFDAADRTLAGEGLRRFSDLFEVPTWVCNLAELDPYATLRPAPAPGPLVIRHASEATLRGRIPPLLGANVFVYAKPSLLLPTLMDALAQRCQQIEVFMPGASADLHNPWPHVIRHQAPIELDHRLHEFSAVVHFGGLNLAAEALFTGVPQLIFPQHLEQSATAVAVQRLGVGYGCLKVPREPDREAERRALVAEVVEAFFADTGLAGRASLLGAQLRARQRPSLPGLVALCEEILAGIN